MIKVRCFKEHMGKTYCMGTKVAHSFPLLISFYLKVNVNVEFLPLANQILIKERKGWQALLTDIFTYINRLTMGERGK